MAEEIRVLEKTDGGLDELKFNAQAAVTFKLVGTNLVALYRKEGSSNTFLVIPTDKEPGGGMTIKAMIEDINAFLKKYDPETTQLSADQVAEAVKDVDEASRSKQNAVGLKETADIDYKSINVKLKQAFLYLSTGKKVEYGFELEVDLTGLFPAGASFFAVEKLSLGIWNTQRTAILERMGIVDFDTYLKE